MSLPPFGLRRSTCHSWSGPTRATKATCGGVRGTFRPLSSFWGAHLICIQAVSLLEWNRRRTPNACADTPGAGPRPGAFGEPGRRGLAGKAPAATLVLLRVQVRADPSEEGEQVDQADPVVAVEVHEGQVVWVAPSAADRG